MTKILITGGAGYIGAHNVKYLLDKGFEVIVFDNLNQGHKNHVDSRAIFIKGDLLNINNLTKLFSKHKIDAVMHFAAFSQVAESVNNPSKYYENNVVGSLNLLNVMKKFKVDRIIFSSTAAVYGESLKNPILESFDTKPTNPYGNTKLVIEKMLKDFSDSYKLRYVSLRYFNAAGAAYGIGEDHNPETHLIPLVLKTALAGRGSVKIFGDDYKTPDGTCIRDYIHIVDLASAHYLSLKHLINKGENKIYNLGCGKGHSVREVINECRKAAGADFKVEISPRRPGDPAVLIASSKKIIKELGWKQKYNLKKIIKSAYDWHLFSSSNKN